MSKTTTRRNAERSRDSSVQFQNFQYKKNLVDSVDNIAYQRIKDFDEGDSAVEVRENALKWIQNVKNVADRSMREIHRIKMDRGLDPVISKELMEAEKLKVLDAVGWYYEGNFYPRDKAKFHPETAFSISTTSTGDDEEKQIWYKVAYGMDKDVAQENSYSSYTYVTTLEEAILFIIEELKTSGWEAAYTKYWRGEYLRWLKKDSGRKANEEEKKEQQRYIKRRVKENLLASSWNEDNIKRTMHHLKRSSDINTLSDLCSKYFIRIAKKWLKEARDIEIEEEKARRLSDDNIIDLDSTGNTPTSTTQLAHTDVAQPVSHLSDSTMDHSHLNDSGEESFAPTTMMPSSVVSSTVEAPRVRDIDDLDDEGESKGMFTSANSKPYGKDVEEAEDSLNEALGDDDNTDVENSIDTDDKDDNDSSEPSPVEDSFGSSAAEERARIRQEAMRKVAEDSPVSQGDSSAASGVAAASGIVAASSGLGMSAEDILKALVSGDEKERAHAQQLLDNARLEEERKAEESRRLEEERKAEEAKRRKEEEALRYEEIRRSEVERAAFVRAEQEKIRLAEEKKKAEEEAVRLAEQEALRKAEQQRLETERLNRIRREVEAENKAEETQRVSDLDNLRNLERRYAQVVRNRIVEQERLARKKEILDFSNATKAILSESSHALRFGAFDTTVLSALNVANENADRFDKVYEQRKELEEKRVSTRDVVMQQSKQLKAVKGAQFLNQALEDFVNESHGDDIAEKFESVSSQVVEDQDNRYRIAQQRQKEDSLNTLMMEMVSSEGVEDIFSRILPEAYDIDRYPVRISGSPEDIASRMSDLL